MADSITIQRSWAITTSDAKKKWHVTDSQTLQVGSKTFVKLPRSHCHFASLVFHGCTTLPDPLPRNFSLSASIGYQNLMAQRNSKQAEELKNQYVESVVPDIFKDLVRKKQPSCKRASRTKIMEGRKAPETLVLSIEDGEEAPWALELVKPLNARDELAVELDPHVINKLIKFLQHEGFSSDLQEVNKKRKGMSSETPQGIWVRKHAKTGSFFYLVKGSQSPRHKKCQTLDDAVMHQQGAKPDGYDEDEPSPEACDAGDEDSDEHPMKHMQLVQDLGA